MCNYFLSFLRYISSLSIFHCIESMYSCFRQTYWVLCIIVVWAGIGALSGILLPFHHPFPFNHWISDVCLKWWWINFILQVGQRHTPNTGRKSQLRRLTVKSIHQVDRSHRKHLLHRELTIYKPNKNALVVRVCGWVLKYGASQFTVDDFLVEDGTVVTFEVCRQWAQKEPPRGQGAAVGKCRGCAGRVVQPSDVLCEEFFPFQGIFSSNFGEKVIQRIIERKNVNFSSMYGTSLVQPGSPARCIQSLHTVSCGPNFNACRTISVHTTIFSAEGHESLLILHHILQNQIQESIIYRDSLSVALALSSYRSCHMVNRVFNAIMFACDKNPQLLLC